MPLVAADTDRRAELNAAEPTPEVRIEAAELRAREAEHRVNAAEREVHMFEAAYGNCQNDLKAARAEHKPDVAVLADGLIRALGVATADALGQQLDDMLRARFVSGG